MRKFALSKKLNGYMEISERMRLLLADMNRGIYEKETEIGLSLLAALAGESVLLLGPPGVAKSMVARRLKRAFEDARSFEYLMSRFSTPDEIFGPVSISRLKESDKYERVVDGYLPVADVVFLDEIWKAGPAIQNTLLTVINERLFRNGDKELRLPLKLLVAASNELPAQGEGLEALWDRFLLRVVCACVKNEETFYRMLLDEGEDEPCASQWRISNEEYAEWRSRISRLTVPPEVLKVITEIRKALCGIEIPGSELHRNVYVSDRRWKNIVRLLKASAFMHGRSEVAVADLLPVYHCLWNEPDERDSVRQIVVRSLFASLRKRLDEIGLSLKADLRVSRVREALETAKREGDHRDDDLEITDYFYYRVEQHGTGNTYIFIVDYKNLKENDRAHAPQTGTMYPDPLNPKRTIIRAFSGVQMEGAERVTLFRDDKHIYINGVRFPMKRLKKGERQQLWIDNLTVTERDYESELERVDDEINARMKALNGNMFATEEDREEVGRCAAAVRKEIAWARVDVRKLRYGEG